MPEQQFLFLLATIKFDDRTTRWNRIDYDDEFAAISKLQQLGMQLYFLNNFRRYAQHDTKRILYSILPITTKKNCQLS